MSPSSKSTDDFFFFSKIFSSFSSPSVSDTIVDVCWETSSSSSSDESPLVEDVAVGEAEREEAVEAFDDEREDFTDSEQILVLKSLENICFDF